MVQYLRLGSCLYQTIVHLFNDDPYQQRGKDAGDSADSVGNAHYDAGEIGRDVDVIAVEATPKLSPVERLTKNKNQA